MDPQVEQVEEPVTPAVINLEETDNESEPDPTEWYVSDGGFVVDEINEADDKLVSKRADVDVSNIISGRRRRRAPVRYVPEEEVEDDHTDSEYEADSDTEDDEADDVIVDMEEDVEYQPSAQEDEDPDPETESDVEMEEEEDEEETKTEN